MAHPIFYRTERAKGDLDPLLVASTGVGITRYDELLNGGDLPAARMEQCVHQPTKEAFGDPVNG